MMAALIANAMHTYEDKLMDLMAQKAANPDDSSILNKIEEIQATLDRLRQALWDC